MSIQASDHFLAFASLHRFFALIETTKPTPDQTATALSQLCLIYGATSEADLLQRGAPEIIQMYTDVKKKIVTAAM